MLDINKLSVGDMIFPTDATDSRYGFVTGVFDWRICVVWDNGYTGVIDTSEFQDFELSVFNVRTGLNYIFEKIKEVRSECRR